MHAQHLHLHGGHQHHRVGGQLRAGACHVRQRLVEAGALQRGEGLGDVGGGGRPAVGGAGARRCGGRCRRQRAHVAHEGLGLEAGIGQHAAGERAGPARPRSQRDRALGHTPACAVQAGCERGRGREQAARPHVLEHLTAVHRRAEARLAQHQVEHLDLRHPDRADRAADLRDLRDPQALQQQPDGRRVSRSAAPR
jgi:hypothetical protein